LLGPAWAFCKRSRGVTIPRSMSCSSSPHIDDLGDLRDWRAWPELKLVAPGHLVDGLEDRRQAAHFRVGADRVARIGAAAVLDVELLRGPAR
jgi:hypothetical protein